MKIKSIMLIAEYTSSWITDFECLQQEIKNGLQELDVVIEHVGSTAVPNLAAKPIIDIDIIYSKNIPFEEIKSKLSAIGYHHHGNQGIEDREVFKRSGHFTNGILDQIKHHLYACAVHSKALERHLLSRNFLRKHQWARTQYQQMKYELAERANQDRKVYAYLKELHVNDFIDSIIAQEKTAIDRDS